jgi:hypothetical protein
LGQFSLLREKMLVELSSKSRTATGCGGSTKNLPPKKRIQGKHESYSSKASGWAGSDGISGASGAAAQGE